MKILNFLKGTKRVQPIKKTVEQGTITDSRDGKVYKTVKIGNQVWMAENLAYEIPNKECQDEDEWDLYSDDDDKWCYYENNKSKYKKKYGILYKWKAAKEACPPGWHLPSDGEWAVLCDYIAKNEQESDLENIGSYLRASFDWDYDNGTDEYGFSALPGGYCVSGGVFDGKGKVGCWWTDSLCDSKVAYYRCDNGRSIDGETSKGYSVRCVQDDVEGLEATTSSLKNIFTESKKEKERIDALTKLYKIIGIDALDFLLLGVKETSSNVSDIAQEYLSELCTIEDGLLVKLFEKKDPLLTRSLYLILNNIQDNISLYGIVEFLEKEINITNTLDEKLDIARVLSSFPSHLVSVGTIKNALREDINKNIDQVDNSVLISALLPWKDDDEILQILLKLLDTTKSSYLAKDLLPLNNPIVDKHIEKAGYYIGEHEVDGYGMSVRHLEKNGVRI